jgi:hypothetical protein
MDMRPFDELLNGVYSPTVTDVSVLVREVRVRIGVLSKPVQIRIYYDSKNADPYFFECSAEMKTGATGSAHDEVRNAPSEGEALRRAVRVLTHDYECAIRAGRMPDDTWLVHQENG